MGAGGCGAGDGGCLCGSSVVWDGGDRADAGGGGLSRGDHPAAELEGRPQGFPQVRAAEAILRGDERGDGLHGEPLHGGAASAPRRRLYARRTVRLPTRQGDICLYADTETDIPRCAGHHRGHRGLHAAAGALRLLGRQAISLHTHRHAGRPAPLRDGGEDDAENRQAD